MEPDMTALLAARMCIEHWGYCADLWPTFHAKTIWGVKLSAIVTDAPPEVVSVALPGIRWEWFGDRRAYF